MNRSYIVVHGCDVVFSSKRISEAMEFAEKWVTNKREMKCHHFDTYIAIVLPDDCRYSAGQ